MPHLRHSTDSCPKPGRLGSPTVAEVLLLAYEVTHRLQQLPHLGGELTLLNDYSSKRSQPDKYVTDEMTSLPS